MKAQTDVLRERAVLREVPELPYGDTGLHLKPEISTGHQQLTRMKIAVGQTERILRRRRGEKKP